MRRLVALLAAFALSLTMVGCAQGQSQSQSQNQSQSQSGNTPAETQQQSFEPRLDTEAEVEFDIVGGLNNFESLEAVINDFNEVYPNCVVNYVTVEDYTNNIAARMLSDTSVGIFMMNTNLYRMETLANLCLDLSQENIDFSAIQDDVISSVTVDGKIYGLPAALVTSGLAVNETLLEKEGLAVPTNYAELKDACEKLKQDGYIPIQGYIAANEESWDSQSQFTGAVKNMVYVQIGNSGKMDEILSSFENAESGCGEVLRPALERLYELAQNGYISDANRDEITDIYNGVIMRFLEGDVPFMSMTTETFSGTKKRETKSEAFTASPFEYSFICAPVADEGAYAYIENWYSFSANKNCSEKDWAVEFIRFLATEQESNTLASIKGMPSVAKNSSDERFATIYPENEDYLYTNSVYVPIWVQCAMNDVMNRIGMGLLTADEAVTEFEAVLPGYKEMYTSN